MPVDQRAMVQYRGSHRDISFLVSAFNFRDEEERRSFDFPEMWCTYLILSPEKYTEFKPRFGDAPWNGGITYERRITEEHIDAPADLKAKWDLPYYKVGDDFSHLWDMENGMYQIYDRAYMERHIKRVIDFLIDGEKEEV